MNENEKTIKFDPGYAPIVMNDFGQIGYIYYSFNNIANLKIKKINFPNVLKKIEEYLKINVAFYLGCLLWASYIKQFENAQLSGNMLLGETASEEEYTSEINFLIDVVEKQLSRDSKYFLGKNYIPNEKYLPILNTYKQFLIINDGFVNCSKVSQINIPDNLKKLSKEDLEKVNTAIQKAIQEKDITQLYDSFDLIF